MTIFLECGEITSALLGVSEGAYVVVAGTGPSTCIWLVPGTLDWPYLGAFPL